MNLVSGGEVGKLLSWGLSGGGSYALVQTQSGELERWDTTHCKVVPEPEVAVDHRTGLRKCTISTNKTPAYFHGWFQDGNKEDGFLPVAIVEFEDGRTTTVSAGHITFNN